MPHARHARRRAAVTAFFDTHFDEAAPRARISAAAVGRFSTLANDRRVARCFAARSYWLVRSSTRALGRTTDFWRKASNEHRYRRRVAP
jgi:hypothetical protein